MTDTTDKPAPASKPAAAPKQTKASTVTRLLSRPKGATLADLMTATGWQSHTVRAFLTGVRKKANLVREERSSGETAYRIAAEATPATDA